MCEGGLETPLACRLHLKTVLDRSVEEKEAAAVQFIERLRELDGNTALVAVLAAADLASLCKFKCGDVLAGSPLAYQQPLVPFACADFYAMS